MKALLVSIRLFVLVVKVPQRSQAIRDALDLLTRGSKLPHAVQNSRPLKVIFAGSCHESRYFLNQMLLPACRLCTHRRHCMVDL